ncbi:alpha/beta hydrolase [Ovoidimarina sediminis]|uniref:alpha/beta hydrolase n=1 Tax=Ovoidimarina sediminis TaxID=3079856 RepID=UPI00290E8F4D|nr:alpha/beta fold hydrolase [Rhodophyticola sp. MJ-SS7]MDU8941960.1 alpha/beta fold hydrolase [Rhodophyticola sp. MJ-SS7]
MTRELTLHRRDAASGTATSLVVFLHGYGADGRDLLGLADPLGPHMPDTAFVAPDAPDPCTNNPMGFQWSPIPWLDGSSEEQASAAMQASITDVNAMLDGLLAELSLSPDRLILFGFSQGCMISLHVAPRRRAPVGGVVGISGRLLVPEALAAETVSRPPIMLIHGDADDVVPFASMHEAGQALTAADFEVYAHVMKGTGHGIAPDGLSVALAFMRDKLGIG